MLTKSIVACISLAASALAAACPAPPPGWLQAFPPSGLNIYDVGDGVVSPQSTSTALVHKDPADGGQDRTTLITFNSPGPAAGKTCLIYFDPTDPTLTVAGSAKLDLFTSNAVAPPGGTSDWPPGNQRGNQLARWTVAPNSATTDATYGSLTFLCNDLNPMGFEIVGVYDTDTVSYKNYGVCMAYR